MVYCQDWYLIIRVCGSVLSSHFKSEKYCGPFESNIRRIVRSRKLSQNAMAAMINTNAETLIPQKDGSLAEDSKTYAMPPKMPKHARSASRTHWASVLALYMIKIRRQRATKWRASGIVIKWENQPDNLSHGVRVADGESKICGNHFGLTIVRRIVRFVVVVTHRYRQY